MPLVNSNKYFAWIGSGLSIVAVIFLFGKLNDYAAKIDISQIIPLALPLIALSLIYAAANLALSFAWRDLLKHFGVTVSRRWATKVFGVSQLAKYVPGNIFHFVSRQALGIEAGISSASLAKSALWEIALLAIAGSMAILLVLPYFLTDSMAIFTFALFVLIVCSGVWIANRMFGRWIARAIVWQMIFLCCSAMVFLALLLLISPISYSEVILVCGAYILAWLAGLITPGSPAGIGIREVVLLALLESITNEVDLLMAISLSRLITISGDFLFYLFALNLNPQTNGEN